MRKRLLAIILVCCLIAPILFQNPLETEAATDQYGFNLETPEDFDAEDGQNPYGSGEVALNPIMEPFVLSSSNSDMHVDYWNDVNPHGNSALDGDRVSLVSQRGGSDVNMMVSKAYDPDGSGHDYMAAVLGISGDSKLVLWYYNTRTKEKSERYTVHQFNGHGADWFGSINQWEYTSYFALTAGDFDGDGGDELAVYVPKREDPYVQILKPSDNGFERLQQIKYKDFMGDSAGISGVFTNNGDSKRSTIQASLEAADLDRDGKDELTILGAFADLPENAYSEAITDRSSRLCIYHYGDEEDTDSQDSATDQWKDMEKWNEDVFKLNNGDSSDFQASPISMRTASCAAGDIDNDGFPELVVAGYFSGSTNLQNDGISGSQFAIVTLDYDKNTGEMKQGTFQKVNMNGFVKGGLYTSDKVQAPPALTCVAVNGKNTAEQVFLAGTMYSYSDTWNEEKVAYDCRQDTNWVGARMITNAYVQTAVAGNFDGNNMGIEQVYYTRGLKQNSLNYFWYDICVLGRETERNGEEDVVVVGENGEAKWIDNRYGWVHSHRKGDKNLFLSLAAVDADDDTDTLIYKRKEFTYTNVNVMAILQAAPYFEDLKDNYYDGVGETVFGKTQGSGGSTSTTKSASVGAYFDAEIPLFAPFLKMDISASYTHDWEWEYEDETTIEYSMDFSGGQMEDSVVLYRTPMTLYYYDVHPAGGGETTQMTVGIPENPVYNIMAKEEYNAIAANDETMKDKVITSSILSSTPGQPSTYNTSAAGLQDFTGNQEYMGASAGITTGNITQSITEGTQSSASQTYNNSFELSIGLGGGGVSGGVTGGGGWGGGSTTFEYSDVSKTGMVANPPGTEYEYSFRWKFGTWRVTLGDTQVPVLGYLVNNVVEPPSLPQDIAVNGVTQDSITISWDHGAKRPVSYEIYQYFDDSVGDNGYSLIATVDGDETEFTYEGLKSNTPYSLAIRSVGTNELGEKVMSEYSALVTGTTLKEGSELSVDSITEEVNVCPGDTAVFKVDATPSKDATSGLTYAWQVQEAGSTRWQDLQSGSSKLTLRNVTEDMDGNRYRCVVSEIQSGDRFYVYSGVGVLHVGKADSNVTVTATNSKGTNTGGADYTIPKEVKTEVMSIQTITVTTPPEATSTSEENNSEENNSEEKKEITETYQVYKNEYKTDTADDPETSPGGDSSSGETGEEEQPAEPAEEAPEFIYRSVSDNNYYALIDLKEDEQNKTGTADKRILLSERSDYFAENADGTDRIPDLNPEDLQGPQEVYEVYGNNEGEDNAEPTATYLTWQVVKEKEDSDTQQPEAGEEDETEPVTGALFNLYTLKEDGASDGSSQYYKLVNDEMVVWDGKDADGKLIYENGEFTGEEAELYSIEAVYSSEPETKKINGTTYSVQYDRTDNTDDETITLYSLEEEDGTTKYYLKDTGAGDGEEESGEDISLKEIYLISQSGMLEGKDTSTDPDTTVTYVAKPAGSAETITETQTSTVYESVSGKPVTLEAQVNYTQAEGETEKSTDGKVTFRIVNNRTGEVTTLSADTTEENEGTASVTWTPKSAGTYTITATFGGNEVLNPSSASAVYYATEGEDSTVGYVLEAAPAEDADSVIYGDPLKLTLQKAMIGEDGNVTLQEPEEGTSVEYTVQYMDLDTAINTGEQAGTETEGSAVEKTAELKEEEIKDGTSTGAEYTPHMSGTHTFTATITEPAEGDGTESTFTSSVTVDVLKRPITMTAPSTEKPIGNESENKIPQVKDVTVSYTGGTEEESKEAIINSDEGVYTLTEMLEILTTPELNEDSGPNNYVTSLAYQTMTDQEDSPYVAKVQQFLNRYDVTLKNGMYQIASGLYKVSYEAGANGSIRALKGDNQIPFDSGVSLTEGTEVKFAAYPDENFKVDTWTVTETTEDGQKVTLTEGEDYTLNGTNLYVNDLQKNINVELTFEPASYTLNYKVASDDSGEKHGSVSAQYLSEDGAGASIGSGDAVLSGSSVRLTAQPEDGYVVDHWTIKKGGEEQAQIQKNEDGSDYAKNTLDIEKMDSDMTVTVSFVKTKQFNVTTSVVGEDGTQLSGGTIKITGDGYTPKEDTTTGGTAVKGSEVTFTAEIPNTMVVREWRVKDETGEYQVVSGSGNRYTVYNVQSDLDVQVMASTVQPIQVTYGTEPAAEANGEISSLQNINSDATLDPYSYENLEFQISPDKGYEIDTVTVTMGDQTVTGGEAPSSEASGAGDGTQTDSDNALTYKTEAIKNSADRKLTVSPGEDGFSGNVNVTVSFKAIEPCVVVTYNLYNLGDGTHGTMQAAVDRLGDKKYAATGVAVGNSNAENATLKDVYRDSVITFTANPDAGYRVGKWTVNDTEMTDGVSEDGNTFTYTVTANDLQSIQVEAQMAQTGDKVTFGAEDVLTGSTVGGTVTAANSVTGNPFYSGNKLGADTKLTFTAAAESGYEIVGWKVNGEEVTDGVSKDKKTLTATIPNLGLTDVRAVFDRIPYTVSWSANGGTVAVQNTTDNTSVTNGAKVRGGRELTFTASPGTGMEFAGWTVTGANVPAENLSESPLSLTVNGNVTVKAGFRIKSRHTLTFGTNDNTMGTLSATAGQNALTSGGEVTSNSIVTFTAQPANGYLVEGWYSDAAMTEDKKIEGTEYEQNKYVLNGLNADTAVYVKFAAIPSYEIQVTGDGTGNGSLQVEVDGRTVQPAGAAEQTNGVDGSGVYTVKRHSKVTVKAIPENEFSYLSAWNGETAQSDTFTIDDVTEKQTVTATFTPAERVGVKFDIPSEGKEAWNPVVEVGSGQDDSSYKEINAVGTEIDVVRGKSVRFTVTPPEGLMIDTWKIQYEDANVETVTGRELGLENTLFIEDADKSMTVSVTLRDIEAHDIPANDQYDSDGDGKMDYQITGQKVTPDILPKTDPEYTNQVRDNGDVSFTIAPAKGKWITDIRLAPAQAEEEIKEEIIKSEFVTKKDNKALSRAEDENILSYKKNADGSCFVTIQNVTRDLNLIVDTVNYYTVSINAPQHGKLTARDAAGNVIKNGDHVAEGTAITFTAAPEKHYRFEAWGKDAAAYADQGKEVGSVPAGENRGRNVELTLTMDGDLTVSAAFAMTEHSNTEIRNAKDATCTENGYTGDTYCKDCGTLLAKGTATPALNHQFTSAVTTDPTTQKPGVRTYTCSRCGYSYTEGVEALPKPVMAKPVKAGRNKNRISWKKVNGADGYIVLADNCNTRSKKRDKIVKKIKTIVSAGRTTWTHKKLKPGTWYKYQIKAFKLVDGKRVIISETPVLHAVTAGSGRYANPVKVKVKKAKISVKAGKKKKIKASVILPANRICQQHADPIRYIVEDKTIATVNKKGVIRAKSKGRTTVYAMAQNGVSKKITVTVK